MSQLPEQFFIGRATIIENQSSVESDSRSKQYRSRAEMGQRWEFRIRSTELEPSSLKPVMAWIGATKRQNGVVSFTLPVYSESEVDTVTATSSADSGDTSISCVTTGIQVGDFFNFGNHQKAYQVSAVSVGEIEFFPNLVTGVPSSTVLTFDGMVFACKIRGRAQQYNVSAARDSAEVEIDIVEDI